MSFHPFKVCSDIWSWSSVPLEMDRWCFCISLRLLLFWNASPMTEAIFFHLSNLHTACLPTTTLSKGVQYDEDCSGNSFSWEGGQQLNTIVEFNNTSLWLFCPTFSTHVRKQKCFTLLIVGYISCFVWTVCGPNKFILDTPIIASIYCKNNTHLSLAWLRSCDSPKQISVAWILQLRNTP